jgi:hypothetical protein
MSMRVVPSSDTAHHGGVLEEFDRLRPYPSPLRPDCSSDERIFRWRGVNTPPSSVLAIPVLQHVADLASRASLRDTGGYGAGLRKFHVFCDVFSIPEEKRLPAAFEVLYAFALWACTTPDPNDAAFADGTLFEPVAVVTARKYLSAVRAWHLAQGWQMKERQRMRARCANATARDDGDECRWGGEEKILRADPGRARSPGRWSPTVTCRAGRRPYYHPNPFTPSTGMALAFWGV